MNRTINHPSQIKIHHLFQNQYKQIKVFSQITDTCSYELYKVKFATSTNISYYVIVYSCKSLPYDTDFSKHTLVKSPSK